ncbi:MAG: hypothetical protein V2I33_21200, partial [Kangiellaceae bacterium]|nr:hypothetical protein [Kangiellaceae bacterium]
KTTTPLAIPDDGDDATCGAHTFEVTRFISHTLYKTGDLDKIYISMNHSHLGDLKWWLEY